MRPDLIRRTTTARIPTAEGTFQLSHYVDTRDGKEHLALIMGQVAGQQQVLVRVHSECFTGDVLGSQRCDCGEQLHQAMRIIAAEGQGVILYLRQEGRGIGLEEKLKAYNLQDQGYDTVDANLMLGHQADEREYSAAAAILDSLDILSIRLMTNNPTKIDHLEQLGIKIQARLPLSSTVTQDNAAYLATKIQRMRHLLTLPLYTNGHSHDHAQEPSVCNGQIAALHARANAYHAQHGQPYVTLTYAQTLDGTIGALGGGALGGGALGGGPLRISGPESLVVTHQLRAHHDAILIGIGTLLADDPKLTVRLVEGASPQPIIVDSQLRTPLDAQLWSHPKAPWIATLNASTPAARALSERGARLIELPANADHQVNLAALFDELGQLGIRSVMAEGGASIIASLINEQLAHYAVITIAPRFQPGLRVNSQAASAMAAMQEVSYIQVGSDMVVWGDMARSQPSLSFVAPAPTQKANLANAPTISSAP